MTWLICLFHQAELPIKALIKYFDDLDDGHTTNPDGIPNGPLGKGIYSLDNGQGPFVPFKRIFSPNLPAVTPDFFNGQEDLKTAFLFSKGLNDGYLPPHLEAKPPVKIHPARSKIHKYHLYLRTS